MGSTSSTSFFVAGCESPLGRIAMASDGSRLVGLWFDDGQHSVGNATAISCPDMEVFRLTCSWLERFFAGQVPDFFPPIGLRGSPFRQRVYRQVLAIPYGSMCSYGEVAARLNRQPGFSATSARAVGNAVAHNPILLIVPCHRVVGTRGALTGYAAGVDRKAALLDMERRVSSRTYG